MTMRTEELITQLSRGLRPVRRLPSPLAMLGLWCMFCAGVIGAALLVSGLRADFAAWLMEGFDLYHLMSAALVALTAGYAAFQLALPDRDQRWALLPVPAVVGWLVTMGWGCLEDLARLGPGALQLGVSLPCLGFIIGLGVPMTAAIAFLTRHAALLRPVPVAALGALSAAAFASLGLTLVHELDAAVMVLVWHGIAVLVVTALGAMAGPLLMRRAAH
ncbi:NrsF family protein [Sediminicoccus sp. BL-A-41-H5]|uniref:NrsF family protein n=1 Tax=Sediminicoccus sp. BL-A-41-H5 TaxID=3421106 RepID=UPI003D673D3D